MQNQQIAFNNKLLHFTSLGCSKNLVDSQVMLGHLFKDGFKVSEKPEEAEAIVVNTCSFIDAAKKESIDTILELAEYKKTGNCQALILSGCMAQRYSMELEKELPEVDLFIGTGEYHKIVPLLKAYEEGSLNKKTFVEIPRYIHTELDPRINTSPFYTAWLKVAEGCNRNCTFCIIPTLRGSLRSRTVESLVTEAKSLAQSGVKEINIIAQDLSDYGSDLSSQNTVYELLKELEDVDGICWIRLFYFYPDDLSDEIMELMAKSSKICSYLDMPVQHFSDKVLRGMNRKITGKEIHQKIKKLREKIPNIFIRTSVIVGFPGESEEDFHCLRTGIADAQFDHLGVFKYSQEEGTPAAKMKQQLEQDIIDERFNEIYELQKKISHEKLKDQIGKEMEVLVEGFHEETDLLLVGRHYGQAPDIDGKVIINEGTAEIGDIVKVTITDSYDHDLLGKIETT